MFQGNGVATACNSCRLEAPSREAAESAAMRAFSLSPEQRRRLVVQERD